MINQQMIRTIHLNALRSELTAELTRRGLANRATYTEGVEEGKPVKAIHVQELMDKLQNIKTADYTDNPIIANKTIIKQVHKDEIQAMIDTLELAPKVGGATSCNAGCTGLCVSCTGTCTGSCTSCTSCTSCSGCSGSCNGCSGCSGNCMSGCQGGCQGSCFNCCLTCSAYCASNCVLQCSSCVSSCSGSCYKACTGNCYSGCATACQGTMSTAAAGMIAAFYGNVHSASYYYYSRSGHFCPYD